MNITKMIELRGNLKREAYEVEIQIAATPTGPSRNALCDANIHLRAAINSLKYAINLRHGVINIEEEPKR